MNLPESIQSILVTRLDSLGDIVLGTMLLEGIHTRWPDAAVRLLVRPQLSGVTDILPDWVQVHTLPFDPREPVAGREANLAEALSPLSAELQSDLVILAEYNRVWASELVGRLCSKAVIAFDGFSGLTVSHRTLSALLNADISAPLQTVQAHADDREPIKYIAMLSALGIDPAGRQPTIVLRDSDRQKSESLWNQLGVEPSQAIVCFPSGADLLVRSLDAAAWVRWIAKLRLTRPVVLLGSDFDATAIDEIVAAGLPQEVPRLVLPARQVGLLAAFLERSFAYLGMDTGPMHVAAALGKPTLGVFGGGLRAHRFLPVGRRTAAIRMQLGCYGCDWRCPFDRRHCIKDIPESLLHESADAFLSSSADSPDAMSIRIFDLVPPPHLPVDLMGPIKRQYHLFLDTNHRTLEHLTYLNDQLANAAGTLSELTARNHQLGDALAEMTRHNISRDEAIAQINTTLTAMSAHNMSRDEALAHIGQTLAEFTRQGELRDSAIAHINGTLAEMTVQNNARDQAISTIAERTEVKPAEETKIS